MTNRLLTLTAACALSLAATAQTWTAPELPSEASTLVSGNSYQIRNAASSMENYYLAGSSTWYSGWSTSLALIDRTTNDVITYVVEETADGWTLKNEATSKYTFVSGLIEAEEGTTLEAYNGLGELHVDMGEQGHQYFSITSSGTNTYRIQIAESDTTYGEYATAGKYLGFIKTADNYPNAVYAFLTPSDDNCCDWEFVDMSTYSARLDLYEALLEAEEAGVSTSEAGAVYENSSATEAELKEAYTSLKKAIAELIIGDVEDGTANDVTALIGNADFSEGSLSPWQNTTGKLVYSSDTFPNGDCNVADLNDNESFTGAVAAWQSSSSGGLADDDVYQTIGWVPAGTYKLTCSLVAQHGEDMPEGVFLYETNNGETKEIECKHDEDQWNSLIAAGTTNQLIMHPTITFKVETAGELTVGVKMVSTNCNWVYFSKFTLTYYGETDESEAYLALEAAIEEAKEYLDTETYYYSTSGVSTLTQAINTAENALTGSDEEMEAAQTALEAAVSVAKADIQAYTDFADYLQELLDDQETYQGAYEEIAGALADQYDSLIDYYTDRSISPEDIQEYIDAYNDWLVELITEYGLPIASAENPLEVTLLYLENANLTETGSLSPWQNTNSVLVYSTDTFPNGDCNVADLNDNETFNHAFAGWVSSSGSLGDEKLYQTISALPRGSYMLTCSMVAQHSTDLPSGVYLFSDDGVEAKTECTHDETMWEALVEEKANLETSTTPNQLMMHPEHTFFHTSDGSIDLGVELVSTNCNWVYGSKFKLYYMGVNLEDLYNQMMSLAKEAETLDDEVGQLVSEADNKLIAAIDAAEGCADDDEDAINEVIEQLTEAIAYANEALSLYDTLEQNYTLYSEYVMLDARLENCDDETYPELLDDIAAALADGFESNDEIEQYTSDLATGFTTYVISGVDMDSATEDNPVDITPALLNADFEGYDTENYTLIITLNKQTRTKSTNNHQNNNTYECYNNNSFNLSQTVKGLPTGYYRVRVQGFYRAGSNADNADSLLVDPTYGQNVLLMANTVGRPICNVLDGLMTEDPTIDGETSVTYGEADVYVANSMLSFLSYVDLNADDESYYWTSADAGVTDGTLTVGLRKDTHISSDWTIWNSFELLYLGTEMPTGIEALSDTENGSEADVVKTQIFTVDGTQLARPAKGINILRKTHADGSVSVEKVLVK